MLEHADQTPSNCEEGFEASVIRQCSMSRPALSEILLIHAIPSARLYSNGHRFTR
jgi:hypothetical protein